MGTITNISVYLAQTALSIYLFIMLMRFVLQLSLADFYNPICQFLVRATNPLVLPLRRVLPARGRFDPASLLLAILIQLFGIVVLLKLFGAPLYSISLMLGWAVLGILGLLLSIYFWALIAMIVLSWVAPGSSNPAVYLIYQITEPLAAPVRRLLPDMGGIDFSPILLFVLIHVIRIVVVDIAVGLQLPAGLVIGL